MTPVDDLQRVGTVEGGPHVAERERAVGEGEDRVEFAHRARRRLDRRRVRRDRGDDVPEQVLFEGVAAILRAEHLLFVLLEFGRREAFRVRERLAALVLGRRAGRRRLRNFDVEAEDAVAAHAQGLDARARDLLRLVFGDPAVARRRDAAEFVEVGVVARRDEVALREQHVGVLRDRAVDQVDDGVLRGEARLDAVQHAPGGGLQPLERGLEIGHRAQRRGEGLEVARVGAPGIDLRDETLEIAHVGEAGLEGRQAKAVLHEGLHRVEARVDGLGATQGLADPARDEAGAHRRVRHVQDAQQRSLARDAVHRQQREMADRPRIEREGVGGFPQPHAPHVVDRMAEGGVDVEEEGAGGADQVRLPLEAEAVQRGDVEVAQQLLARRVQAERPGIGVGGVES